MMIKKINGMLVVAVALSTLSIGATDVVAAVETGWKKNALKAAGVAGVAAAFLLLVAAYKKSTTRGQRSGYGPVVAQDPVITKSQFDSALADLRNEIGVVRGSLATNKDEQARNLTTVAASLRSNLAGKADSAVLENTNNNVSGLQSAAQRAAQDIVGTNVRVSKLEMAMTKAEENIVKTNDATEDLGKRVGDLSKRQGNLSLSVDQIKVLTEARAKEKAAKQAAAVKPLAESAPLAETVAAHVSASDTTVNASTGSAPLEEAVHA